MPEIEFHYIHLGLGFASFPYTSDREIRYLGIILSHTSTKYLVASGISSQFKYLFIIFVLSASKWASFHRLFVSMTTLTNVLIFLSVCLGLATVCNGNWNWWYAIVFLYLTTDTASINTLRPRRNRRHFADDIFKCILLNENVRISIKISLKFVPQGPINNILALVQIMDWRRPGDKPLSEPMMTISLTHICVTRPQWVNKVFRIKKMVTIAFANVYHDYFVDAVHMT